MSGTGDASASRDDAGAPCGGVHRFNGFTLDLTRGCLLRPDGVEVPLRPKAFALLARFVENAGRLMDREEILRAIWPGVTVTEDSITQCVREIRRALGDEEQKLLRTLPRRGFLFAAEVTRIGAATSSVAAPPMQSAEADGANPHPGAGRPVVAVAPFEAIGGDRDDSDFAAGLTADLMTGLTCFQSLTVMRRPGLGYASADIAGYVVSGGVRRAAGLIRVTIRLEDAATGAQVWAERLDRPADDPLAAQEDLAGTLAARLVAQVEQETRRRSMRRPPATLAAYELCLRGRELRARMTEADTLLAREMFDRAIAADPGYATAHAWQAFTILRGLHHWWGEPTGLAAAELALVHARRAVELERESPLCLSRIAMVLLPLGKHDEALEAGHAAVRLNPASTDARLCLGDLLAFTGEPEAGLRETRVALDLDPYHPPGQRYHLARNLLVAGRPEEARAEYLRAIAQRPDYGMCYHGLAVAAWETGRAEEARSAIRETLRLGPRWTVDNIAPTWPFRRPADWEPFRAAFVAAGLPEG